MVVVPETGRGSGTVSHGSFGIIQNEPEQDIQLDYAGTVQNAAKVTTQLYRGDKRLVFCDSKAWSRCSAPGCWRAGVTTHLVHASLSLDEWRRAEQAFAEGRDCVIVSTSALELGVDVGTWAGSSR